MLVLIFLSPLLMVLLATGVVFLAELLNLQKASIRYLFITSIICAAIGAGITLCYTIGWMYWYQYTTGYDAGNAPAFWIIFYGPAGASVGQLLALIIWWFKKPIKKSQSIENISI